MADQLITLNAEEVEASLKTIKDEMEALQDETATLVDTVGTIFGTTQLKFIGVLLSKTEGIRTIAQNTGDNLTTIQAEFKKYAEDFAEMDSDVGLGNI